MNSLQPPEDRVPFLQPLISKPNEGWRINSLLKAALLTGESFSPARGPLVGQQEDVGRASEAAPGGEPGEEDAA